MGEYRVQLKPSALKELEALSDELIARVIKKLEALVATPRPPGCKKLLESRTAVMFTSSRKVSAGYNRATNRSDRTE